MDKRELEYLCFFVCFLFNTDNAYFYHIVMGTGMINNIPKYQDAKQLFSLMLPTSTNIYYEIYNKIFFLQRKADKIYTTTCVKNVGSFFYLSLLFSSAGVSYGSDMVPGKHRS